MFKQIKLTVLKAADSTGVSRLVLNSTWRKQRLLILCYHGISLQDEHQWDSSLYMAPELLRRRFQHLRDSQCVVLPLGQAIKALQQGTLPPRAVAITFDDGFFDFYHHALPIAADFGFPLTVYLTTYYSFFNRPVFDPTLSYMLWKSRGQTLRFPEALDAPVELSGDSYRSIAIALYQHVTKLGYDGYQKNEFLVRLSRALRIDFDAFCSQRLLHLMTPAEAAKAAAAGANVQLHTHRHRVSASQHQFQKEIKDNRERVEGITGVPANHFCFPSGFFLPEYQAWLHDLNIASATTCIPGIASASTSPLLLPRLVDTHSVTGTEFNGWVTGLASFLPHRKFAMDQASYIEVEPEEEPPGASI